MNHQFAFDLKLLRRRSGLTQADCAHLLGRGRRHVSRLENGECPPTPEELTALSIMFGRTADSLLLPCVGKVRRDLSRRLEDLPHPVINWMHTFNRQSTLSNLAEHLSTNTDEGHDSA